MESKQVTETIMVPQRGGSDVQVQSIESERSALACLNGLLQPAVVQILQAVLEYGKSEQLILQHSISYCRNPFRQHKSILHHADIRYRL